MHRELGLILEALDSFPVASLLRAADITMQVPPLRRLPILPPLFHQCCLLSSSLGVLGPSIQVCLTFGFFRMLHQSNFLLRSHSMD